jgi:hypothetical protein
MRISAVHYMLAAIAILGATVLIRSLVHAGVIDGQIADRSFMVALGVMICVIGNHVPKALKSPRRSLEAERRTQAALRTVGWTMTSAGLLFSFVWVAAPESFAAPVSLSALAVAFLVTATLIMRCKAVLDGGAAR